jgi:uncharacterized protein YjeT (DUF2065 family)
MATFGLAVAQMLVFEGLLPLIAPARWREIFRRISDLSDGQIRFFGLISIVCGAVLYLLVA